MQSHGRQISAGEWEIAAYLNPCFEGQEGVPGIAHLEYAAKAILGQIPYLEYLQVGRDGAEIELVHEDVVDDDGRLGRLIEGGGEHLLGAQVELGVCRQRRPVEVEGHYAQTLDDGWMSGVAIEMMCGEARRGVFSRMLKLGKSECRAVSCRKTLLLLLLA